MYYRRIRRFSMLFQVFLAASLTGIVGDHSTLPTPLWDNMQVKHTWNAVPENWECLGPPPSGTTIDLHIALKPHRENALIDALYEVSDPRNQRYGAHLSKEQVAEIVAPHIDTLGLVNSWLEHSGISFYISATHGGGWLTVPSVPVSTANELLGASYQLYRYSSTNKTILRTIGYELPMALHAHVQTVVPTTHFSPPRILQQALLKRSKEEAVTIMNSTSREPVLSSRNGDSGDDDDGNNYKDEVTVNTLRSLYETREYVPSATDKSLFAVVGFVDDVPSQTDLTLFMNEYRADTKDATFTLKQINGGPSEASKPSEDADMNVQYALGMAYPIPLVYYSVGGDLDWDPITYKPIKGDPDLEWLKYVLDLSKIPQTISISYGIDEQILPQEYTKALCDLFAQLGARGVSVLLPSGNDGVGEGDCKDDSGNVVFRADFPSSCMCGISVHNRSVGGTGLTTDVEEEVAAELSGGGFSSHFQREEYQDILVPEFLQKLGSEYAGLYDAAGRGIPDISSQALEIVIIQGSDSYALDGTSASLRPNVQIAASIISLLNDYQLANGRKPLGFLNPWLYGQGITGLNDITSGTNPGCETEGFSATVGWDPVTGLGTPRFVELQNKLPKKRVLSG
ncbi:peptidase S8/S53 domain-containing protein [Lactarius quietus]|nr:peptidase S8/S53 domain-containing protein [Lactarius quietus]